MNEIIKFMSLPYVGPWVVVGLALLAALIMVTAQYKRHPEDFDDV